MRQNNNILLAAGAALLFLIARKRKQAAAVGAINVYKAISMAQQAGVDFTKDLLDLDNWEESSLDQVAQKLGFKRSAAMKKNEYTLGQALYKTIRPTWKRICVSGVGNIDLTYDHMLSELYDEYPIVNADGEVIAIWRDYENSPAIREFLAIHEDSTANSESSNERDIYVSTLSYIAAGGKFTWDSIKKEVIASRNPNGERKQYISIIASPKKGGKTIWQLAHDFSQMGDDLLARDVIIGCLREGWTPKTAKEEIRRLAHLSVRSAIEEDKRRAEEAILKEMNKEQDPDVPRYNPFLSPDEDPDTINPDNLIYPDDNKLPF